MVVDQRFVLIDRDGVLRYPYKKQERATGRYGFALGNDKGGKGEYTESFEEMVRAVVLDGKSIRATTLDGDISKRGNIVSLHAMREIQGYAIDPAYHHLIEHAVIQPTSLETITGLDRMNRLVRNDYIDACKIILGKATANQLEMLKGHAIASGATLDMEAISALGGYTSYESANIQYGKLGRMFADFFGISDLANQTQAIAVAGDKAPSGHWQWTLRPELVAALIELGIVEEQESGPLVAAAEEEIDQDPRCVDIPETTRRALINARVGQGGYRKRGNPPLFRGIQK